ncbi:MAG: ATP-binding protein [Flavobacteriales bacterium]|nr:MAG: ATP-binding protein [Flavobacteriales bacterium]
MRWLPAWFVLLLAHHLAHSQGGAHFESLHVPGIEDAVVRTAAVDRFGALWLGTNRGVHRFDGSRTESYLNDPLDSLSLPDDVVHQLVLAPDGAVWAATFGGAWRIDPLSGERRRLPLVRRDGTTGSYECTELLWSADGTLWAFCNRSGLARLDPTGDRLSVQGLPEVAMARGGHVDADGVVWLADRQSLGAFDPRSGTWVKHPYRHGGSSAPPKTLLLDVLPDVHDPSALWCTSWGLGLVRFDRRSGAFDRQAVRAPPLSDLVNITPHAVQRGRGTWWCNMDGHLVEVDASAGTIRDLPMPGEASVPDLTLLADLAGVGVLAGSPGVVHLHMPGREELQPVAATALSANTHIAPASLDDGYWIVRFYADREVMHLDADGRLIERVPLPAEDRPYEAFRVMQDARGRVWLASDHGLLRYRPGSGAIEQVQVEGMGVDTPRPNVLDLHEGPDGATWAALGQDGLLRCDPEDGGGRCFRPPVGGDGGASQVIGIERYETDRLLVDLGPDGPALFNMASGAFELVCGPRTPKAQFRASMGLLADDAGRIYALSRSHGVIRMHRDHDGAWSIERRWLPPERPYFESAVKDARGRLWLLAGRACYLLDPDTEILVRLDPLHGFAAVVHGLAQGHDGGILIDSEGWKRVRAFEPSHPEAWLMVREARSGSDPLSLVALQADGVELPHTRNSIQLAFGVVALFEGDAFTYAYRITRDGTPGEWAALGRQRSFSLLDLRPGAYEVDVRAESPSSKPVEVQLRFVILPPWWARWWAIGTGALLAVLFVVLLTRMVLNRRHRAQVRELERERELERVRMRIARDIHDGIGSGLTKITMLSRQMDASAAPQAARIAEASTELVNELGEIVWTVDPRNDSFASFLAYVRSMLGRQFEDLQVQLIADLRCADADRERTIGPELKRNILLVLKEAVNNALKHSGAARIAVQLHLGTSQVELLVRDNGHGFDPQRIREGANGLANFSKRAEALGGAVKVDTGPAGTTVTFQVPLPPTNM